MKELRDKILKQGEKYQHIGISISFLKWLIYGSIVGVLCGGASALFLHLLGWATDTREKNSWLIYLLPIAGMLTSWIYIKYGKNSSRGNNLILEEIQNKKEIFFSTYLKIISILFCKNFP